MARRKRTRLEAEAERRLRPAMIREGEKVRRARRRRRWTQRELGRRCGLAQSTISQVERGHGGTLSAETWQRIAIALDLPLELTLGRDAMEEPVDAGHLAIQELILRLARMTGRDRTFELPTRPSDPRRSTDVGLVDHVSRCLILVECVNTFGDIGAAVRSSERKRVEAEGLGMALGGDEPYALRVCWVVRDTRRNRVLVQTYPELFETRFRASSRAWAAALTIGSPPPTEPGLVWCDVRGTRLFAWRRRG